MKRLFDFLASAIGVLLLGPLFLIVAAGCLLCQGRPILFSQERPGTAGRIFRLWKFRTMRQDQGVTGESSDADRLTRWGRFLRATTLDELPQLWNVLCGEMSLVGPRPLLVEYLPLYSLEQSRRHEVRPGLTGWAQVRGRNALTWAEKFKLDVWYVDHRSIWLDLKIILLTVLTVLSCQGITQKGSSSMEKFTGNEKP
jgi:lipopolysaccharide/colanic/teichoic acid biosynthesis glycosyltransferase